MAITSEDLAEIGKLYVALFARAPDTEGLSFWSSALSNGADLATIRQGFLESPEGQFNYPLYQSAEEFVSTFYEKVFGRTVDTGGLAFWSAALVNAGGADSVAARDFVVASIISVVGTPLTERPADFTDAQYLETLQDRALFANKVEYGVYLATRSGTSVEPGEATSLDAITADVTSVLDAKAALSQARVDAAIAAAQPFVGTPANDVIRVTEAADLDTSGFSIDGGDGEDVLILGNASGAIDPADGKVVNVEALRVTAVGDTTVNATKFAGVTSFAAHNATATLDFANLTAGQSALVAGTNTDTGFAWDDTADAATLSLTDAQGGTVRVAGTALRTLEIIASGTENYVDDIDLGGTGITAVEIEARAYVGTVSLSGLSDASLTVTGRGEVYLGALSGVTVLDASANTGGLFIDDLVDANQVTGSQAHDSIGLSGSIAADASISLAGGDDELNLADGAAVASGALIDGGEGYDILRSTGLSAANAAAFTGFEALRIVDNGPEMLDLAAFTGNRFTDIIVDETSGTSTLLNVDPATTLRVQGSATAGVVTTLSLTDAAANADTFTVVLQGQAGISLDAGTISLPYVETVVLQSQGGASSVNALTLTDAQLQNLVIQGDAALSLLFTPFNGLASLDASAATGALYIDSRGVGASADGLTIAGGTGEDAFILGQAATVSGGDNADLFDVSARGVIAASESGVAGNLVTITDFGTGDQIDFGDVTEAPAGAIQVYDASSAANIWLAAGMALDDANEAVGPTSLVAFRFAGDTYIVADTAADGLGTGDVFVKLNGLVDLSSVIVGETGLVSFA